MYGLELSRAAFAAVAVGLGLACAACGDPPPIPEASDTPELTAASAGAPAAARYLTTYAFTSAGGDEALYSTFRNETGGSRLVRNYAAWLSREGSWTRVLGVQDSLPVPRAGWRLLPTDALGILVGDGAQVVGLRFRRGETDVHLRLGDEIAAWTGATGQVQALYLAGLETGEDLSAGFVFFHRAARSLDSPPEPTADRVFLLADTLGNALLIEASVQPDEPAVARTWLHGTPGSWSDVTLVPTYSDSSEATPAQASGDPAAPTDSADSARGPTGWLFVIPQADLSGELRITPEEDMPGPASPTARRAIRISGELVADGESFRFQGLTVELPLP
jgi:hypothetical protein